MMENQKKLKMWNLTYQGLVDYCISNGEEAGLKGNGWFVDQVGEGGVDFIRMKENRDIF